MHQQGSGHIVNISSVAATAHIPFQTFYSASKAAVSSYSYALANEVRPYGIYVTAVELGDIRTGFTKSRQKNILGDKDYDGRISRSVSRMEHDEQNGMAPEDIGSFIADIVTKKKPSVLYVAGTQYKFLSLLCKILPFHIHSSFQNCRTKICKFKNQIQLAEHFLNLVWCQLLSHDIHHIGISQC